MKADPRLQLLFLKIFKNYFSRREIFFMEKNEKKLKLFFKMKSSRYLLKPPRYYIKMDIDIGSNCIQDRMKKICEKTK